jgi:hypothetical protein
MVVNAGMKFEDERKTVEDGDLAVMRRARRSEPGQGWTDGDDFLIEADEELGDALVLIRFCFLQRSYRGRRPWHAGERGRRCWSALDGTSEEEAA